MKSNQKIVLVLCAFLIMVLFDRVVAQNRTTEEQYTGTAISFNGPRTATSFFDLRVTGQTSDEQARQYLSILDREGQNEALDALRNQDLGRFSFTGRVGRPINVVRETQVEGRRRIFIVFERWTQLAEVRFGYRSLDYPFGVIELFIDDRTGRGEGTYIPAARIRLEENKRTNQQQLEIENFAIYPVKLTNVTRRGANRRR